MNFKKTQIKQTVEKILLVAQKNNGYIPISSINDASNFYAYLEGYSSWQAFVEENIRKNDELTIKNSLIDTDFKKQESKKITFTRDLAFNLLENLPKNPEVNLSKELIECKDLDKKINLGTKYNKITKSRDVFFLNKEDTIVIGKSNIKDNILKQMNDNKSSFLILTEEEKSSYFLNPISEIFETKLIDVILGGNQSIFEIMWLDIINSVNKEMNKKLNIDFLLRSLDLDFIASFSVENEYCKNNSLIKKYLESIGVDCFKAELIQVESNSSKLHLHSIRRIADLLKAIKFGYEKEIFSDSKERIIDILKEKKSIHIFTPKNSKQQIYDIFNSIFSFNFKNYDRYTNGFKRENYGIWFISGNKKILNSEYFKNIISIKLRENILDVDNILEEQIIFSKLDVFGLLEKDFLVYFYLNTKNLDVNIFSEAGKELMSLSEDDFYLWQKINQELKLNKITI